MRRRRDRYTRPALTAAAVLIVPLLAFLVFLAVHSPGAPDSAAFSAPPPGGTAATSDSPSAPPVRVCGHAGLLRGPAVKPRGAIRIPAGSNVAFEPSFKLKPDTTYWFEPGLHILGHGAFDQIQPQHGDTFLGAPGAVLSGQGRNQFAFASAATDVTIKYLTIEGFVPPGSQGAVNQDLAPGWHISHNTIRDNAPGAGLMVAGGNDIEYNCLTANGEYGFSVLAASGTGGISPLTGGPLNVVLSHNEISYNNTCNFENVSPDPVPAAQIPPVCRGVKQQAACGCSGGGKFWQVQNAVVDSNYVHDNYDVGLWADTNNDGFVFRRNYIADNYGQGILYEISYNALIENNTFLRNAIGAGPANPGFPTGAIYISESGGDSRVPNSAGIRTVTVSHNNFTDNWSGVVLWESADRFCGSPDNSSTGVCTLVSPKVATIKTCSQAHLSGATSKDTPDLYDLCRWKTQNVQVSDNSFVLRQGAVRGCQGAANACGENGIFSQYGTDPGWSPYKGFVIEDAITAARNNRFTGNSYSGPWRFVYREQSNVIAPAQWQAKGQR
jgi:Right handed beta helix region